MPTRLRDRAAGYILVGLIVAWLGYSFYVQVLSGNDTATLRTSVILGCERAKARSQIFQEFAHTAADARRRSAVLAAAEGNDVVAAADLKAADKYDDFARRYDALTTKDCTGSYKG